MESLQNELIKPLNIFYNKPGHDRRMRYDHYPRKIIHRIIRAKERPGGVTTIAINLIKGLDKLGIPYHFNDYRYIKKHPEEAVICGSSIYSHSIVNILEVIR